MKKFISTLVLFGCLTFSFAGSAGAKGSDGPKSDTPWVCNCGFCVIVDLIKDIVKI